MPALEYTLRNLPVEGNEFFVSFESSNLTGSADLVAGQIGKSHYVTEIYIVTGTIMRVDIGSGTSSGSVVTRHISFNATIGGSYFYWRTPNGKALKFNSGASVGVDTNAIGYIWLEVRGKTCWDSF